MKTKSKFAKMLRMRKISNEMLGYSVYGANKRAKNALAKEREYDRRYLYSMHDCSRCYRDMKDRYYVYKDIMLEILKPKEIHKIVYEYYHRSTTKYFLYYDFGCGKAHHPIDSTKDYPNLEVVSIDDFSIIMVENNQLASPQFIRKIAELISSGEYEVTDDLKPFLK